MTRRDPVVRALVSALFLGVAAPAFAQTDEVATEGATASLGPLLGPSERRRSTSVGAKRGTPAGDDRAHHRTMDIVLIVLTVIGALALLTVLGMSLIHAAMLGWMIGGGGWLGLVELLIIAGIFASAVLLLRHRLRL